MRRADIGNRSSPGNMRKKPRFSVETGKPAAGPRLETADPALGGATPRHSAQQGLLGASLCCLASGKEWRFFGLPKQCTPRLRLSLRVVQGWELPRPQPIQSTALNSHLTTSNGCGNLTA